ncbi:uncharacterized protein LOC143222056 [Tachypleus tridentatus]|uniref:uncharacterized protein LOC143222056 n=1 Tax=Tachypleus tridentatus TaxID=6853 RepID=UPI003FD29E5E
MKVVYVALFLFVNLTLMNCNDISSTLQFLCEMNENNPGKVNKVRNCMGDIFREKSESFSDAIEGCEKATYTHKKYNELLNVVCTEERRVDAQKMIKCIMENYKAAQVDINLTHIEMREKCF